MILAKIAAYALCICTRADRSLAGDTRPSMTSAAMVTACSRVTAFGCMTLTHARRHFPRPPPKYPVATRRHRRGGLRRFVGCQDPPEPGRRGYRHRPRELSSVPPLALPGGDGRVVPCP